MLLHPKTLFCDLQCISFFFCRNQSMSSRCLLFPLTNSIICRRKVLRNQDLDHSRNLCIEDIRLDLIEVDEVGCISYSMELVVFSVQPLILLFCFATCRQIQQVLSKALSRKSQTRMLRLTHQPWMSMQAILQTQFLLQGRGTYLFCIDIINLYINCLVVCYFLLFESNPCSYFIVALLSC